MARLNSAWAICFALWFSFTQVNIRDQTQDHIVLTKRVLMSLSYVSSPSLGSLMTW